MQAPGFLEEKSAARPDRCVFAQDVIKRQISRRHPDGFLYRLLKLPWVAQEDNAFGRLRHSKHICQ